MELNDPKHKYKVKSPRAGLHEIEITTKKPDTEMDKYKYV